MTPSQLMVLLALTIYALYRQSIRHEVTGHGRFTMALAYGLAGLAVGGFYMPIGPMSWAILAASVVASVVVGIVRGRLTRLWVEPDGRLYSQGTPVTIALFVLLVSTKWAVGTMQYLAQPQGQLPTEHGGFGEVLIMIALMMALQAEVIRRRAVCVRALHPLSPAVASPAV